MGLGGRAVGPAPAGKVRLVASRRASLSETLPAHGFLPLGARPEPDTRVAESDHPPHPLMEMTVTFAGIAIRLGLPSSPWAAAIIQQNFAAFDRPEFATEMQEMDIEVREIDGSFSIFSGNEEVSSDVTPAQLLYEIEGVIVPRAQLLRADLVFIHAGVVSREGRVLLLVGGAGAGKSTLTWALSNDGFRYCSDELAPVQIRAQDLFVYPYPHAICLKQGHPELGGCPSGTFQAGHRTYIPVAALDSGLSLDADRVTDIFFVSHRADSAPEVLPLSVSDIAFRIYPHLLNALAHPKKGLGAAKSIAERANGYLLRSGHLGDTCELVRRTIGA